MTDEFTELESERKYLENHVDEIMAEFGADTYVAIKDHKIIDHDENMFDLTLRISNKYGERPILITSINEYINQPS